MSMTCRYDPTHTGYSNAVVLAQHYALEHADVYVQKKRRQVTCAEPGCGVTVNQTSIRAHYLAMHPEIAWATMRARYVGVGGRTAGVVEHHSRIAGPLACTYCGKRYAGRESARKHTARAHPGQPLSVRAVEPEPSRAVEQVERLNGHAHHVEHEWTVDDVVVPVMTRLATDGVVPVKKLPVVFAWRDATAVMLRELTRGT